MAFNINNFGPVTSRWNFYPTYWIYNSIEDALVTVIANGYFNPALSKYVITTGDKIAMSTSIDGLSFSGTFRNDGAGNLYVDWDRTYFFDTILTDFAGGSASTSYYGLLPDSGVIVETGGVQWAAVTGTSTSIFFDIDGVTISDSGFSVTSFGLPGQLYTAFPTSGNILASGNTVSVNSDGSSMGSASLTATLKIICPAQV